MPYTPSATDVANPTDAGVKAATAALEFRTLKLYLRDVILAELALRAPLLSPTLTGTPTAPTAASGTNTTQLATTAFVKAAIDLLSDVAGSVVNSLTPGAYLTGSPFNGSAARTFAVDATSANTASKVVARDASGNFSAGTITAALTGNASSASAVPWSGVSSKPTTLAGYGITDAAPIGGAGTSGTWGISISGTAAAAPWSGITGKPTAISTWTNDSGYVQAASAPTFTGVVKARGGGLGLGQISVTTTPGTPSGMSAGDLVLVY